MGMLVRDLNDRIRDEFHRRGVEYRRDDQRVLYVEQRENGLVLCDYNDYSPLDDEDVAEGSIEKVASDWITATS